MYDQIMLAVNQKLEVLFPEVRILTGPSEEEIQEPYFETGISQALERCVNGSRYSCTAKVFVNYYPLNESQSYEEQYRILEVLMDHFEFVSLAGVSLKSNGSSGSFENGNLFFQTEYQMHRLKNGEEEASMEDMKLK